MTEAVRHAQTLASLVIQAKGYTENLDNLGVLKSQMSHKALRREFRTIKIQAPRRFGSTLAAIKLLDMFPASIVVTLAGMIPIPGSERFTKRVLEARQIRPGLSIRGLVIIDPASGFHPTELETLMDTLDRCGDDLFFVLLS